MAQRKKQIRPVTTAEIESVTRARWLAFTEQFTAERKRIIGMLLEAGWSRTDIAARLGITRMNLRRYV